MERRTKRLSQLASWPVEPVDVFQPANRHNGLNRPTKAAFDHEHYMRRALRLARRALGETSPNPLVGAVIVRGKRIVGEGYHRRAGLPHAEAEALRRVGAAARGATLYVTLEPCNHTGRTPPCCDAILAAGLSRVIVAVKDPNPLTNGRGIARLRRAGLRVQVGMLEAEARELNAPFFKAMTTGLPWVVAKIAQSLDGKIATSTGASRWITSPAARRLGHRWRARVDAVLIGVNTVLKDDPLLTVRGARPRADRPLKVIADSRLRTPSAARCLSSASPAPALIATTAGSKARHAALTRMGAEVVVFPPRRGRVPLRRLFRFLAEREVQSVLIEGGGELLASAIEDRLVDRVVWCIAPILLGGRTAPSSLGGSGIRRLADAVRVKAITQRRLGTDLCLEGQLAYR